MWEERTEIYTLRPSQHGFTKFTFAGELSVKNSHAEFNGNMANDLVA